MKKIALITHSYHKFTKSGQIYADEIFGDKSKFKIDYFFNDEWNGNSKFEKFNSKIDGYDLVLIVQLISSTLLKNINCKNIVFVPMYDHSRNWGMNEWLHVKGLKILSPSTGIYKALRKFGLNSLKIKYYPEPDEYREQDFSKIFFWNRVQTLDYKMILTLFKKYKFTNLNIHNNHDPNHTPIQPSFTEINDYNITFSDWFEHRRDYLKFLDSFGIYIAPRPFEGDGAAFIDSMKKGKIVIAPNNHPYTDYIDQYTNGILYNLSDPEEIEFKNLDLKEISFQAHNSVVEGRKNWVNSLPEIHDYIFNNESSSNNLKFESKEKIFLIKKLLKSYLKK